MLPQTIEHTDVVVAHDTWNVVLLDDDHHTYGYVVGMIRAVFGKSESAAFADTVEVDTTGRCIVAICGREQALIYQQHVHSFGPDPDFQGCAGSMSCVVEKTI